MPRQRAAEMADDAGHHWPRGLGTRSREISGISDYHTLQGRPFEEYRHHFLITDGDGRHRNVWSPRHRPGPSRLRQR